MTIELRELPFAALRALRDGDLAAASVLAGIDLSEWFVGDDCRWLWRIRVDQLERTPGDSAWIARIAVDPDTGTAVGHGGFHAAPDAAGIVEVGYSTHPAHRRLGYARQILAALVERASRHPEVRTVRASISPTNAGSLATIAGFGFAQVGEQWDEEDGLELLFERPAHPNGDSL